MKDVLSVSLFCVWSGPSETPRSPCALEMALTAAQELLSARQLQREQMAGVGVHSPPQAQLGHTARLSDRASLIFFPFQGKITLLFPLCVRHC